MKRLLLLALFCSTTLFAQSYWEMKKEAYALYKSGDKKSAVNKAEAFVAKYPQDFKAQNLVAVFYYWNGENKKAKNVLNNILSKTDFPEAKTLLTRVNKKLGKASKRKKSSHKNAYATVYKANKKSQLTDLEYLVSKVSNSPLDIKNRVLLSKFYFKTKEYQKSYDLAYEVLILDPKNKKMQTIEQHLSQKYKLSYSGEIDEDSAVDKQQAKNMLKKLYAKKEYNEFYNLYEALDNAHVIFSKEEYLNILHVSIMLEKYKVAESILSKGVLPVDKNSLKVQLLLSKKLATSVASK